MVCGLIQYLHRKPNRNKETSRNVQIQGGEPEWGPLVPLQAHVSGEASRVPKQEVKQKCSNFTYKILLKLPALSPAKQWEIRSCDLLYTSSKRKSRPVKCLQNMGIQFWQFYSEGNSGGCTSKQSATPAIRVTPLWGNAGHGKTRQEYGNKTQQFQHLNVMMISITIL